MGHSPAMTLGTYAHVIRELKGEPIVSAEVQVQRARRKLAGRFRDAEAAEAIRAWRRDRRPRTDGETRTRTGDTTIFSRVLYQLSYLAEGGSG
jgi:hypothetical protein